MNLLRGRKAQITVFMIVGIILLFSSALLFYIRGQIVEGIPEEFIPTLEEVPLEAQPVKIFVEDCVKRIGTDAINKIGVHGGYVMPNDDRFSSAKFFMGFEPTESDGIMLLGDDMLIPYWWHLKSPNRCSGDCRFESLRPPLRKSDGIDSIEEQMDRYIDAALPACIDNFDTFREQGFDIEIRGPIKTDTTVAEREVLLLLDYPITLIREGRRVDVDKYLTKLDIDFKEIYEMATEITNKEMELNFLEEHTANAINMYSMPISSEKLPPMADFTLDPAEFMYWTRTDSQERLEAYVLPYVTSMLQVDQARNFKRVFMFGRNEEGVLEYDKLGTALMDKMILRLDKNYTTLETSFTYLDWWPIYLNINDQEVLTAKQVRTPLLSWIGLNNYVFWYSVSYPVMVTIRDPDAFAGKGYEFRFAIEENMRYNEPINTSSILALSMDEGTLMCNPNQKTSEPVTIDVVDAITGEPVEDVRLDLIYGQEGCNVGVTELDDEGRTVIVESLPGGFGELQASHKDYLDYSMRFFASPKRALNYTVEMMPYRYINASVFVRPLSYKDKKYVLPPAVPYSSISQKESGVIMLERVDDDMNTGYKAAVNINGPNMTTTKLVPGTYEVRGTLILNDLVVIPAEEKVIDPSIFMESQTIRLNRTEFETWQEGGVMLNNITGYFEVSKEDLFSSQRINFYMLRFPKPMTHSTTFKNAPGLEQTGQLEDYSNIYRTELEPEWIR